jgi:excisionase family DNA binding protein
MTEEVPNVQLLTPEQLLTPDEVAEYLRVERRFVIRLAREGRIRCVRVGKYPRFRINDVRQFVEAGGSERQSDIRVVQERDEDEAAYFEAGFPLVVTDESPA